MLRYAALLTLIPTVAMAGSDFQVIDGDTISDGTTTYRLHGIDTAEAGQKCAEAGGGTWRCDREALAFVEDLVLGHDVVCDNRGTDDYDRVLSVCLSDGIEINAALVEAGLVSLVVPEVLRRLQRDRGRCPCSRCRYLAIRHTATMGIPG